MPWVATAAALIVRDLAGINRDPVRARQEDGTSRLPLARAARPPGTLPRQAVLQRAPPGPPRLLAVLRPVDLGNSFFFHAPCAAGYDPRQFRFRRINLHRAAGAEFDVEFEHIGFWDLRVAIADNYAKDPRSSSPATPPTATRPMACYGIKTPASRMPAILGWKLAAVLEGWAEPPDCLESYQRGTPAGFASDRGATSSRNRSRATATSSPVSTRKRTARAFEAEWKKAQHRAGDRRGQFLRAELWRLFHRLRRRGRKKRCQGRPTDFKARAGPFPIWRRSPAVIGSENVFEALGRGFTLLAFDAPIRRRSSASALRPKPVGLPLSIVEDTRDGGRERYEARFVHGAARPFCRLGR